MKRVHTVIFSVFCKSEEDAQSIENALLTLVPFKLEDEKIELKKITASGLEDKKITILEIILNKERHTNQFLNTFLEDLSPEQRKLLLTQDNRLDEDCNFFIRLDKDALLDGELLLTDGGNCVHIKLTIAAFPKKKESALKIVQAIFGDA